MHRLDEAIARIDYLERLLRETRPVASVG